MAQHGKKSYRDSASSRGAHAHSGSHSSRHSRQGSHSRNQAQSAHYGASAVRSQRQNPSRKAPIVFGIVLAIIVAVAVLFGLSHLRGGGSSDQYTLAKEGSEITVTIAEGSTSSDIAEVLGKSGLISSARDFNSSVKSSGAEASLKPGTYRIVAGSSVEEIIDLLEAGPGANGVTIPEGFTIAKTAAAFEEATGGQISEEEFVSLASDASAYASDFPFLEEASDGTLEGFLFPKTYEVGDNDTADSIIRTMLAQYQSEVAELDYSYPKKAGLSEYETLILASIIEREATDDNRATVASVFYNRLEENMNLQSDATVAYIIDGDPTPADLEIESPYNTYLVKGLPEGPICSPSLASLQAACKPESTKYLYFYFTEDGKYSFSETYEEHQKAIEE